MKKILLTGASGFLGGNFCHLYANQFDIHGIYNGHPVESKKAPAHQLDLTDPVAVQEYFQKTNPDAVIHLAAYSDPNQCELHPDVSEKINIETSENLAYLCSEAGIPFVFSSTDLVFDGSNAPYKETDIPAPVNTYGLHKAIAENSIQDIYTNATICRLPLMFGNSFGDKPNILQQILKKLSSAETLNLFTDEYRSVASARDVCSGLILCMDQPGKIFHLGGDEKISRYDFGKMVCEVFGNDNKLIVKSKQREVKMPAARPKDVSMVNEKAKSIGWKPGNIRDELESVKKEMGPETI